MSMKTSTDPRTVYARSGNLIVLFEGRRFSRSMDASKFEAKEQVVISPMPSDGGRARVKLTCGKRSEIWRSCKA